MRRQLLVGAILFSLVFCGDPNAPQYDVVIREGRTVQSAFMLGEPNSFCIDWKKSISIVTQLEPVMVSFFENGVLLASEEVQATLPGKSPQKLNNGDELPQGWDYVALSYGPFQDRLNLNHALVPYGADQMTLVGKYSERTSEIDLAGGACDRPWHRINLESVKRDDPRNYDEGDVISELQIKYDSEGAALVSFFDKTVVMRRQNLALMAYQWTTQLPGFPFPLILAASTWVDLERKIPVDEQGVEDTDEEFVSFIQDVAFTEIDLRDGLELDPHLDVPPRQPSSLVISDIQAYEEVDTQGYLYRFEQGGKLLEMALSVDLSRSLPYNSALAFAVSPVEAQPAGRSFIPEGSEGQSFMQEEIDRVLPFKEIYEAGGEQMEWTQLDARLAARYWVQYGRTAAAVGRSEIAGPTPFNDRVHSHGMIRAIIGSNKLSVPEE